MSMISPAQMQALNQQAVIGDPRTSGILGASSSPFANSIRGPRLTDQGSEGLQAFVAQVRAGNVQFSPSSGQTLDPNAVASFEQALAEARQRGLSEGRTQTPINYIPQGDYYMRQLGQSNPTGAPQPVQPPLEQMQPISAPQSLGGQMGGQMGGGMTGPQFPGQGGGQGGIGSLLQPIQARMIQQFNQQKVVPLLNNFERNAQATITGGQGMQQGGGYGGGMPQQRMTTMGPESFGPPLALVNRLAQIS